MKDFHAKKSLGQNFLKNPHVIEKIIEAADLKADDVVVEAGPGMGVLTEALLLKVKKVIAIEKDSQLFGILTQKFEYSIRIGALKLISGDALKIAPPSGKFKLVANIPYYITSPLLDHFIRENTQNLPQLAVVLVQKEVAAKICAAPPRMNVLALHVQTFGDPEIVMHVSKGNFSPAPKVDSAVIKIEFSAKQKVSCDLKKYFELIHSAFAHKRKMLRGTLPESLLKAAGIDPTVRPETLQLNGWERLANANL
ncbi:MAG: 16S rRNA (adenine(1518)-N(6)/adenine(1519)-N(6))-dimethyltransferase RsmA [Patescibacteria group bacterium]